MTSDARLGIGGNNPPDIETIIHQQMAEENAEYIQLMESVLAKAENLPKQVTNDEESGLVSDWIKKAKNVKTTLDAIRKKEKEVWSSKANAVHSFFKKRIDTIDNSIEPISEMNARYLQEKKDREERERAEKARLAAEEAERKLAEAREKERIANEAREAAEAEQRRIQAEKEEAERLAAAEIQRVKDEAAAEAARVKAEADAKAKAAQDEIDRLNREAAEVERKAQEKALQDQADIEAAEKLKRDQAAAAEALKQANKDVKTAARAGNEILKEADREVREINKDLREEHKAADETLREANAEVKAANREFNHAMDGAVRADKFAMKAERQTLAGSAELSRTRGDNSLSSLSEKWVGELQSREELDLEALREHIPAIALNQAIQSWVNANEANRSLRGAYIWQDIKANVR